MLILSKLVTVESVERNSRFIAIGLPCQTVKEFRAYLSQLRDEHPHATHIAYAYKIRDQEDLRIKFSDDGEPSGTAGKPILNHLEGSDLINAAIFVIRYFGGIKLGAGGLVRAYGHAARECLSQAILEPHVEYKTLELSLAYKDEKQLNYAVSLCCGHIDLIDYGEHLRCRVRIPQDSLVKFSELFPQSFIS